MRISTLKNNLRRAYILNLPLSLLRMFIEPNRSLSKKGWIEVISGSMFSGKTEELIRRLRRAQFANQRVQIYKPVIDTRYDDFHIVSHNDSRIPSTPVETAQSILSLTSQMEVVAIDEAQFFDDSLPEVVKKLASNGVRVIVAGLDMDYLGKPFGPIPTLLAMAEFVTKLHAICVRCGENANFSYRRVKVDNKILLGEKDVYEPLCRACFNNP